MNTSQQQSISPIPNKSKRAFFGFLTAGSIELILWCSTLSEGTRNPNTQEEPEKHREFLLQRIGEMRLDFNGKNRNTPRDIEMTGPDEHGEYTLHSTSLKRATSTPIRFTRWGALITREIIITPQNEFTTLILSGMDLLPGDICLLSQDSTTIFIKRNKRNYEYTKKSTSEE